MGRPVVHWEFWSEDPAKIAEFYEKVFDWNTRSLPNMDYRLVETGGEAGINGGIMKPKAGPWPAGGRILVEKTNVPGVGELSLFEDPDGRVLGLWKQQF
jgi:uncharacterized protein